MNSECESHNHPGGKDRGAVGGNCVAARRGGEQPETEDWSRTKVNSIRHVQRASLLGDGEACRESGESVPVQGLPILETGRCGCGWSGNDPKGAWDKWRERPGSRREGPAAGRAFIVAMKPGNSGGAKGRRLMKTRETVTDQTSSIAARLKRGKPQGGFATATNVWRPSWIRDARASEDTLDQPSYGLGSSMRSTSPLDRGKNINGRAGCGRPACPVRREGRVSLPVPTPIDVKYSV